MDEFELRPESAVVAAGRPAPEGGAAVNVPIALSTTYLAGSERIYAREGNASIEAFENALAVLEGGSTTAFASGMAAAAAIIEALPSDSVVVLPRTHYNVMRALVDAQVRLGRCALRVVDMTDTAATVEALPGATVVWLELPSNPMLDVPDLPTIAAAARSLGAMTVVDSTVATPLGIRPLAHGADVVLHSATKWVGGHSDLLMGTLSAADASRAAQFRARRTLTGGLPGSLESYLALRGLRTLSVRLERACANAATLASRLREHVAVTSVRYLGFDDHPQANRIKTLLDHHGSLLAFTTDTVERADRLCERVRLVRPATSLGGVESLIERRGRYPGELAQGTPAQLVRLSVGIEHVEDLWTDLSRGLA